MSVGGRLLALGAVALVAASAAGAWFWVASGRIETTDNAYLRADAAVAAPRVEGYLGEIVVRENQKVSKGDVLVLIDDGDFQARVEQAIATRNARQAQVRGDRAAIGSLKAQAILQRSVIEQSKAGQAAAEAEAERARLDYERYKSLAATSASSAQRLEAATSDHLKAGAESRRAAAAVEAEQSRLEVLASEKLKSEARLKQSEAELAEAEAALSLARINLQDTRLRAPFDGVVGNLSARVGQYVRPGSALLTVVPQEPYVIANFKETQVSEMRPGQPVTISVDAFPGVGLRGLVESFAPATGSEFSILPPENATGNFTKIVQRVPVRIRILERYAPQRHISSGLSVVVSVDTSGPGCEARPECDEPPSPRRTPDDDEPKTSSVVIGERGP
jgi:membrane fusion protein (multidrug efflux system)